MSMQLTPADRRENLVSLTREWRANWHCGGRFPVHLRISGHDYVNAIPSSRH